MFNMLTTPSDMFRAYCGKEIKRGQNNRDETTEVGFFWQGNKPANCSY